MLFKLNLILFFKVNVFFKTAIGNVVASNYEGESFPVKYLEVDETILGYSDLNKYLSAINDGIEYFHEAPNDTDGSGAIGLYMTKVVLKRILLDYDSKLKDHHKKRISNNIKMAEYTVSNFIHMQKAYGIEDIGYRFSNIMHLDDAFVYSIRDFNENRLRPWLLSKSDINEYIEAMDDKTLPKEVYIELVESIYGGYFINLEDSDRCLSHITYNIIPTNLSELRPCSHDPHCIENLLQSPSVAYTLSHRFLNIMLLRTTRRCYLQSKHEDDLHMDMLCAHMYREAVYIARRGFFSRDLFLEHIALCAMLGYKEFYRPKWFIKSLTWMKEDGCMVENPNFWVNRSAVMQRKIDPSNKKEIELAKKRNKMIIAEYCHPHPTVLLLIVIAHAIRYILHVMNT